MSSKSAEKNYIVFFNQFNFAGTQKLLLTTINSKTGKEVSKFSFEIEKVNNFIENLPSFIKTETKAAILNVFHFDCPGFQNNVEFCEAFKTQFKSLKISYNFMDNKNFTSTLVLISAGINDAKMGETYVLFFIEFDHFMIMELCRNKNGYDFVDYRRFPIAGKSNEQLRNLILGKNETKKPKKIIVVQSFPNPNQLRNLQTNILKSDILATLDFRFMENIPKFMMEVSKWMENKMENNKFHIAPFCKRQYFISHKCFKNEVFSTDLFKPLPFSVTLEMPRSSADYYLNYYDPDTNVRECLQQIHGNSICHKNKLTLTVDENYFPNLDCAGLVQTKISCLHLTLNEQKQKMATKLPIIGFFDNSSYMCVYDEKNGGYYKPAVSWGYFGKDLFLSFHKETPTLDVEDLEAVNGPSVVYDLIKIMSMPPTKIEVDKFWNFSIIKDPKNQILIKYLNFRGIPKTSTLCFLMALILKEQLKVIKNETGMEAKELGFILFDKFDAESKQRVVTQLETSCKLMGIGFKLIEI